MFWAVDFKSEARSDLRGHLENCCENFRTILPEVLTWHKECREVLATKGSIQTIHFTQKSSPPFPAGRAFFVSQMRAAVFVAAFAVAVAATMADSEPGLTVVTSEVGASEALENSLRPDFSRRTGKQFPVAENAINPRGSGGGRQKASNLVSGKPGIDGFRLFTCARIFA